MWEVSSSIPRKIDEFFCHCTKSRVQISQKPMNIFANFLILFFAVIKSVMAAMTSMQVIMVVRRQISRRIRARIAIKIEASIKPRVVKITKALQAISIKAAPAQQPRQQQKIRRRRRRSIPVVRDQSIKARTKTEIRIARITRVAVQRISTKVAVQARSIKALDPRITTKAPPHPTTTKIRNLRKSTQLTRNLT